MIERCRLSSLPFPWYEVPAEGAPLATRDVLPLLHQLLEDTAALAGTAYGASRDPETAEQDVSGTLRVLSEHLQATLALWERWERTRKEGR